MKPTENRVPLVLLAAFAVLLAAAFFRYEASPLVVLVPVPLLALLSGAPRWGWSRRRVAVGIFLAGLIGMLAVKYWMIANDPGEWALVGGLAALFSQLLIWIAVALAAASGYALFGWLAARFAYGPDLLRVRSVAVVPAAWIVGEYARAWAVSLAVGGPGSSLGPAGNFGNLGFALAGTPAAEPLSVIGLYGGAGAVVLSGLTLYAVCRRNLPVGSAGFAVLAVCFIAGSIPWTKPERPIQAGVVQAATGTSADANVGVPAAWQPADLLVFSEFAAVSPRTDPNGRRIAEAAARTDGVVISTESRGPAGARVGTIWFETPQGGEIARQEKTLLVPGEYLPSIGGALLGVAGGSVAAGVQAAVPEALVSAAFHHLPARSLGDLNRPASGDVLVCSDHEEALRATADLIGQVPDLRAFSAGSLAAAGPVEAFTAILLGLNARYKGRASIHLTGIDADNRR